MPRSGIAETPSDISRLWVVHILDKNTERLMVDELRNENEALKSKNQALESDNHSLNEKLSAYEKMFGSLPADEQSV